MLVQVRYRIDAHAYDPRRGGCVADCRACRLEAPAYASAEEAVAAQPLCERALEAGDQGALELPARRFEVIVVAFVG